LQRVATLYMVVTASQMLLSWPQVPLHAYGVTAVQTCFTHAMACKFKANCRCRSCGTTADMQTVVAVRSASTVCCAFANRHEHHNEYSKAELRINIAACVLMPFA